MKKAYKTEYPVNALPEILATIPNTWEVVSIDFIETVGEILERVGLVCESLEEIMSCLKILENMGLLEIKSKKVSESDNHVEYTYKVRRNF